MFFFFFFSSRRRHTRLQGDWSSDVCSSDLPVNLFDPRPGTPLADTPVLSPREALQAIALFRLILPGAWIRLAGGREKILGELQSMGLYAGANALIIGNYLTT